MQHLFYGATDSGKANWLFQTNPILSQKQSIIEQLHPVDITRTHSLSQNLLELLSAERELWNSMTISPISLKNAVPVKESEDTKKEILTNSALLQKHFGNHFDELVMSAVSEHVPTPQPLLSQYAHAAHTFSQMDLMFETLQRQRLFVARLQSRMSGQAHTLSEPITQLKLSLDDQKAIIARLPNFSFKK